MDIKKCFDAHLLAEQIYLRKKIDKAFGVYALEQLRQQYERQFLVSPQEIAFRYLNNDDPDPEAIAEARIQAEEARQQYRDEQAEHGRRGAEARSQRVEPEKEERDARIRKRHQQLIDADEPSVIKQLMREFDCSKSTIERALKN